MPNHVTIVWGDEPRIRLISGIKITAKRLHGLTLGSGEAKSLMERAVLNLFYEGGDHNDFSIVAEALVIFSKEKNNELDPQ